MLEPELLPLEEPKEPEEDEPKLLLEEDPND